MSCLFQNDNDNNSKQNNWSPHCSNVAVRISLLDYPHLLINHSLLYLTGPIYLFHRSNSKYMAQLYHHSDNNPWHHDELMNSWRHRNNWWRHQSHRPHIGYICLPSDYKKVTVLWVKIDSRKKKWINEKCVNVNQWKMWKCY